MNEDQWYFDRAGQPMGRRAWGRAREIAENRQVADDYVGGLLISTVWVGMDLGVSALRGGPPEIFETMVFDTSSDDQWATALDSYTRRYATLAEAVTGHAEVLTLVRLDREVST